MFLDTSFNSFGTVLLNIYDSFIETATKMWRYAKCLPVQKQPGARVVIRKYYLIRKCYATLKTPPPQKKNKSEQKHKTKTYNSGYSLVVTDPTTNPPISSLCMAERTGCPVLLSLWSYVTGKRLLHPILTALLPFSLESFPFLPFQQTALLGASKTLTTAQKNIRNHHEPHIPRLHPHEE
jgi:hypothetical protein